MPDDDTRPDATRLAPDGSTAAPPPFHAPGRAIDTAALHLRGLPGAGDRVGDFELVRLLGAGQFARVFLAKQLSLGRPVALKVSRHAGGEARTLAILEHDHIVRVFSEAVEPQRELHLLCMQYVAGTTLAVIIDALAALPPEKRDGRAVLAVVDEHARDDAPFDPAAARDRELLGGLDPLQTGCWLGARLAEALAYAHGQGVRHRDVKPANVLVNRYGRPLLADFNVSSHRAAGEAQTFGGTIAYMSPEHLDAFRSVERDEDVVDGRSDLYSLGVVLYELFAGRRPFDATGDGPRSEQLAQLSAARHAGAPPLSDHLSAPAALERVVGRCLAPRPEERYQSAGELAAALESCRELCRVGRDMPPGGWLTRAALARPFLVTCLLIVLPQLVGSAINIWYNATRLAPHLEGERPGRFVWVVLAYNAALYPACLAMIFGRVWRVCRVRQRLARPGPVSATEADDARRQALRLPVWCTVLSAVGWLPGGVLFPLALDLSAGAWSHHTVYVRFVFSFTISGLIALTFTVIAMEYMLVRVLYPGLWLDARRLRDTARVELAREEARVAVMQFFAVLIPVAGVALLVQFAREQFEGPLGFQVLVPALLGVGAGGLALALLAGRQLRRAVDALTAASR